MNNNLTMESPEELYIFSNDPVPPVKEFQDGDDYINLSTYLNPEVASAPSFAGTPESGLDEIDRLKRDVNGDYDFVHVYCLADKETGFYDYSHKEFNVKNERKRA